MAYIPLGARPVTAVPDQTGNNSGNWTATFDQSVIGVQTPVFEMYHVYFTAPTLATGETIATVKLNQYFWDITLIGQGNSWDPSQPMLMQPGDTLYIMFNVPVGDGPAPLVTAWFRYNSS